VGGAATAGLHTLMAQALAGPPDKGTGVGAAAGIMADTGLPVLTATAQAAAGSASLSALPELATLAGNGQKARARGQRRAALPTPACRR
jgi:hypothetical protein